MTVTTRPGPRTPLWAELQAHASRLATVPVGELFERDPRRYERFSREQAGLLMDVSRQRLDEIALAQAAAAGRCSRSARAHRRDVARRAHQRHRGSRGAARGAAPAAGRGDRRRGHRADRHGRTPADAGLRRRACAAAPSAAAAVRRFASSSTSGSAALTWAPRWRCRHCVPTPRARRAASSFPTSTAAIWPRYWKRPSQPRRCSSSRPRPSPRSRP